MHGRAISRTRHTIAKFSDADNLAVQVIADISRTISSLAEAQLSISETHTQAADAALVEIRALIDRAEEKGISYSSLVSAFRRTHADLLAASGERNPRVFLSYSQADKAIVRQVAEGLKAHDMDIWLDEDKLSPGNSVVSEIEKGLDSAEFVLFFLSNASMRSHWARVEMNAAISRKISHNRGPVIVPVLLEDVDIPPLLRDVLYLDMRGFNTETSVKKLVASIRRLQLEQLHTYEAGSTRYYNPPHDILKIGRSLAPTVFADLIAQLENDEVLFGLYRNQANALVATHLHSKEHMDEMEHLWAPAEGYYALQRSSLIEGSIIKFRRNSYKRRQRASDLCHLRRKQARFGL
jgi:TIR domain